MMAQSAANNPQASALAQTYARALFDLTQEEGATAEVAHELEQLAQLLQSADDLRALFEHRTIAADRRAATLRNVFESHVSDITFRFLMVLNDKSRLDQLASIQIAFDQLVKEMRGEVDVELHSAQPLDASQAANVAARISEAIGKTAQLSLKTDPSLIGGLKIRIGDRLIDSSVSSKLRRMQNQLQTKGHELTRTAADKLLSE